MLPRAHAALMRRTSDPMLERASGAPGFDPDAPELVPDDPETDEDLSGPHEYTWKTRVVRVRNRGRGMAALRRR